MTGQAAGLVLCFAFGVPALVLSWLGHREHRRDKERADFVRDRDGL